MMVVDASVAAKWVLPESGSDEAGRLLQPPAVLLAPELLRVEVAAAITRKLRQQELSEQKTAEAYAAWRKTLAQGTVQLLPDEELLDEAVELSRRLRHALQDCLYLAVAIRHDIPLVTADRTLRNRAAPVYANVRLLTDSQAH